MLSNTKNMTGEERWEHNSSEAYVVFLKVAQVPDHADPHKQRGGSQKDAAHVVTGQVLRKSRKMEQTIRIKGGYGSFKGDMFQRSAQVHLYLRLYFNLQYGSNYGQKVADDDQHIPAVQELFLVVLTHFPIMFLQQELGEPLNTHQSQSSLLQRLDR